VQELNRFRKEIGKALEAAQAVVPVKNAA
jgi:hypothetical protein